MFAPDRYYEIYSDRQTQRVHQTTSLTQNQSPEHARLVPVQNSQGTSVLNQLGEDINALEKKLHGFKIGAKNAEVEKNIRSKISVEEQEYVKNCQKRI